MDNNEIQLYIMVIGIGIEKLVHVLRECFAIFASHLEVLNCENFINVQFTHLFTKWYSWWTTRWRCVKSYVVYPTNGLKVLQDGRIGLVPRVKLCVNERG